MLVRAASAFVTSAGRLLAYTSMKVASPQAPAPCVACPATRAALASHTANRCQNQVHLEDGGPYSSHGTDNARAKGAHGGWANDIFAGVGRGGSCSGRHARLLIYLPDYQGKQGKVDGP